MPHLSYVWGAAGDEGTRLPKVVKHAIIVTKALGMRYLWVDRYCIDQIDKAQKHNQIVKMNLIYEGAEITIVNTAGDDAESGLPGVGNEPRPPQPQASIGSTVLVSTLRSPRSHITKSVWSTRGWTYQEGILSNRRLVFTNDQVYFECRGMWLQETIYIPLAQFHTKPLKWLQPFIVPGLFTGKYKGDSFTPRPRYWQEILEQLRKHLENYTSRKLSYPTDSLNAFRGILKQYSLHSKGALHSVFGLPVITSSYQELISSLAYSICTWHHQYDSEPSSRKRIRQLPSWTWAGWEGEVSMYAIPVEWGKDFLMPVTKPQESSLAAKTSSQIWNSRSEGTARVSYFSLRQLDGSSLEHLEMSQIVDILDRLAPCFMLHQPYVLKNVDSGENILSAICTRFREHISPTFEERYIKAYFSVKLRTNQRGAFMASNGKLECIFMGLEGRFYITLHFLIVQINGKYGARGIEYVGERIGAFSVNFFGARYKAKPLSAWVSSLMVRRGYDLRVE
jgi:hypothetical protein